MVKRNPPNEEVRGLCLSLKPILGKQVNKIWQNYLFEDKEGKEEIAEYLEMLASSMLSGTLEIKRPVILPPDKDQAAGSFGLGNIFYNGKELYPFGLRQSEIVQHIGIFGRSGSGKTNLGFLVVQNLVNSKLPFLIFDWKRNYRDLLNLPGYENVLDYTIGRKTVPFRFNPLIPPKNTPPKVWMKKLIEVIAHAFFLGDGVIYLLQTAIDHVYEASGVYEGNVKSYPTFRDVLGWLKEYPVKGREQNWMTSTLRAVSTLCFGEMDNLINTGRNEGLEDLMNKQVILELDSLTQSDKIFFIETLILWIHHFRMAQNRREKLDQVIMIEEAHHILSTGRRSLSGGESVMDVVFREIREFGVGLIVIDQHPSEISLTALGNAYTTICMNLKSRSDVSTMAGCMLLHDDQKDVLGNLDISEAVVKLQGRVHEPFMIKIPEMDIKKGSVTDEQLAKYMAPHVIAEDDLSDENMELSDEALDFLKDVALAPKSGIAARYKRLGVSVRQGEKVKHGLLDKGLVKEQENSTSEGRIKIIWLTDEGEKLLESRVDEAGQTAAPDN